MPTPRRWKLPAACFAALLAGALLGWLAGGLATLGLAIVAVAEIVLLLTRFGHVTRSIMPPPTTAATPRHDRLLMRTRRLASNLRDLRRTASQLPDAVVLLDQEQHVRWCNHAAETLLGLRLPQDRGVQLRQRLQASELAGWLQQGGEREPLHDTIAPGKPDSQISVSLLPFGRRQQVLLARDTSHVTRLEQMRRDFVANVSHELRTPLTSISGYVETLLDGSEQLSPLTREFLAIILKNATRMNRLTEDLLALASVESGDYKLALQPMRASAIVEDAIESLTGMVLDSDIELIAADTTDAQVVADPDALNQVFGNLIENAMKYGKSGKRVMVGARLLKDENMVEFFVRDFGPGIASEHLDRIFERFYRVDKARSRDSGGTGLGLAIVKHIVMAHGGAIRAESELGAGVTFFFTLPCASRKASSAELVDVPAANSAASPQ